MQVKLPNVRLSFADLYKPRPGLNGGDPRYGAKLIFEPGSKQAKAIEAAIEAVAVEKWGKNGAKIAGTIDSSKMCLRDGDLATDKDGNIYDGYEGMQYVAAYSKRQPTLVDRARNAVDSDDGTFYPGCYVNAIIDIYAMDVAGRGKSINAALGGLQFFKDGDSFGGGAKVSADQFDEIDDDSFDMYA